LFFSEKAEVFCEKKLLQNFNKIKEKNIDNIALE